MSNLPFAEKECSKCRLIKPAVEYSLAPKAKSGLQSQCKQCKLEYNKAPAKKIADSEWKKNNPEKVKEQVRKYYSRNKEKLNRYCQKYYLENKDQHLTKVRKWQNTNQEKHRATCRFNSTKRDRLVAGQKIAKTFANQTKEFYQKCPSGYEVDHIIPLRGKLVTGLHVYWNMQYLTPEENLKKGNRIDLEKYNESL